jgi:hypothetical protein
MQIPLIYGRFQNQAGWAYINIYDPIAVYIEEFTWVVRAWKLNDRPS